MNDTIVWVFWIKWVGMHIIHVYNAFRINYSESVETCSNIHALVIYLSFSTSGTEREGQRSRPPRPTPVERRQGDYGKNLLIDFILHFLLCVYELLYIPEVEPMLLFLYCVCLSSTIVRRCLDGGLTTMPRRGGRPKVGVSRDSHVINS